MLLSHSHPNAPLVQTERGKVLPKPTCQVQRVPCHLQIIPRVSRHFSPTFPPSLALSDHLYETNYQGSQPEVLALLFSNQTSAGSLDLTLNLL